MIRCLRPRRLLLVYVSVFLLTVIWLAYNIESFCPQNEVARRYQALKDDPYKGEFELIEQRSKELAEYEKRLKLAELKLKQQFPEQINHILEVLSLPVPVIYAITPTYARPVQKAELTRLMNTFLNVPNFHWIVIEDAAEKSLLVSNLLKRSGLKYTHLNQPTPSEYKLKPKDPNWLKPRGVLQRNKGLSWLRENIDGNRVDGVVYFADDDNTYDLQLFEEMRFTKKVSVWPVGLVGYLRYERPVVRSGKVIGWFTYWLPDRPFAMDMAGFAINIKLFFSHPEAEFSHLVRRGELESDLISKLGITLSDLEPKADDCSKILVWHTRTEQPSLKNEAKLKAAGKPGSDPNIEV